jgi:hypothetical protein
MAKPKDKKPRPDKYAEKVAINKSFDEVLHLFSEAAHLKIQGKKKATKLPVETKVEQAEVAQKA